eukprot:Em0005g341a
MPRASPVTSTLLNLSALGPLPNVPVLVADPLSDTLNQCPNNFNYIALTQQAPCSLSAASSSGTCGAYLSAATNSPSQAGSACPSSTLNITANQSLNGLTIECRDVSSGSPGTLIGTGNINIAESVMASKCVHAGSESISNYFSKKAKDMGKTQDEDIVHAYNLIHSVISDIAIFRENIEKDFHDWFMDASRIGSELGIVLTVPRLSGRQQHRVNAGPENPDPEVYYRINVAIPFLDHMEQLDLIYFQLLLDKFLPADKASVSTPCYFLAMCYPFNWLYPNMNPDKCQTAINFVASMSSKLLPSSSKCSSHYITEQHLFKPTNSDLDICPHCYQLQCQYQCQHSYLTTC